jgi:hypothetical protein
MFVRTKKVGEKRYNQLVENYREDGRHRQRVVAHLGHHDTVEGAIEDLRRKLQDLEHSKLLTKAEEYTGHMTFCERNIRFHFRDGLDRFHGGELPSYGRARVELGEGGRSSNEEVERTPRQQEYCRAFSFDGEERPTGLNGPNIYGHTTMYRGNYEYKRWLSGYYHWKALANSKRKEYEHRYNRLLERIAKLESVVTN